MIAHVMGLPIEESVLELAPAGAAMVSLAVMAGRTRLGRLTRWLRQRPASRREAEAEA